MEQLKLNMIPNGVNPVFHASQYDKGRQIRFVLDETLSGAEVTVSYRAKDGTEHGNVQTSVSGNTITDTIPEEVLTDYGIIEGEVNIDGIGSLNFFVEVEKDAYDGGVITTQTATGAIATFETNIETAFVSLKSEINPVQDLHGYSKPWAGGGGKNKLENTSTVTSLNSVTFTKNEDGSVKLTGTASAAINSTYINFFTLPSGTYIFTDGTTSTNCYLYLLIEGSGTWYKNGDTFTVDGNTRTRVVAYVANGSATNLTLYPMIRLASVSDASFVPYSNICPISGFSALNVTRTGVNLWDEQWEVGYISVLDGRNSSSQVNIRSKNYIPIKPNVSLYLKANIATVYCPIIFYDKDKNFLSSVAQTLWNRTITTPENAYYMRFYMNDSYGTTYNHDISINYPSSDTEYHAYNGQTATIDLGQTVYGGVYDITNGKVTVTHGYHQITGTENWAWAKSSSYSGGFYTPVASVGAKLGRPFICTHAKSVSTISEYEWGTCYCDGSLNFRIMQASDTVQDWKNYLASQYSNGTPVSICYELATPIEITTTPENLTALSGQNNVYSDTNGDTTVEYYIEV